MLVRRKAKRIFVISLLLAPLPCLPATVNGIVQGIVADDLGNPIGGARVSISYTLPTAAPRFATPPVITGPLAASAVADASGVFNVEEVRAGTYIACAQTQAQGFLDPCHWAASAPEFTVVAGQGAHRATVVMARGAEIAIHVNDPQGLLNPAAAGVDFDCQFQIITAKGLRYQAAIQSSSAVGRDHAITVPFNQPFNRGVLSPHLVLNDATGKVALQVGASITAAAGLLQPTIVYTVVGKK